MGKSKRGSAKTQRVKPDIFSSYTAPQMVVTVAVGAVVSWKSWYAQLPAAKIAGHGAAQLTHVSALDPVATSGAFAAGFALAANTTGEIVVKFLLEPKKMGWRLILGLPGINGFSRFQVISGQLEAGSHNRNINIVWRSFVEPLMMLGVDAAAIWSTAMPIKAALEYYGFGKNPALAYRRARLSVPNIIADCWLVNLTYGRRNIGWLLDFIAAKLDPSRLRHLLVRLIEYVRRDLLPELANSNEDALLCFAADYAEASTDQERLQHVMDLLERCSEENLIDHKELERRLHHFFFGSTIELGAAVITVAGTVWYVLPQMLMAADVAKVVRHYAGSFYPMEWLVSRMSDSVINNCALAGTGAANAILQIPAVLTVGSEAGRLVEKMVNKGSVTQGWNAYFAGSTGLDWTRRIVAAIFAVAQAFGAVGLGLLAPKSNPITGEKRWASGTTLPFGFMFAIYSITVFLLTLVVMSGRLRNGASVANIANYRLGMWSADPAKQRRMTRIALQTLEGEMAALEQRVLRLPSDEMLTTWGAVKGVVAAEDGVTATGESQRLSAILETARAEDDSRQTAHRAKAKHGGGWHFRVFGHGRDDAAREGLLAAQNEAGSGVGSPGYAPAGSDSD